MLKVDAIFGDNLNQGYDQDEMEVDWGRDWGTEALQC